MIPTRLAVFVRSGDVVVDGRKKEKGEYGGAVQARTIEIEGRITEVSKRIRKEA
jgi:hypothetical protein